ncbi:hypothetical protein [Thalassotalea ganghwensis]
MKKVFLVVSILLFSQLSFANTALDNEPLLKIVKDFDSAIKTKDKSKFLDLFYEGTVSWVGVSAENDFKKAKSRVDAAIAKGERARMPMKNFQSDPEKFIDGIIARVKEPREVFENIKILHDGEVATIYFDYEFYDGEVRKNWGKESWLLVNTEKGWKINSVIFSITRG